MPVRTGAAYTAVVRETDAGIIVRGPRLLATLGPLADEIAVYRPARPPLMVARNLFIRTYPRIAEILHLLGASSLMALPTEADLHGPLAAKIHTYLDTTTASAAERVRLFRLAWDMSCSAFGARQVLYERYFGGDWLRNAVILYHFYDRTPMTTWVREFLEQE